jgi:hypothetical protein
MNHIGKLIAFGVFAASTTVAAHAVAITGSISGNDTNATFNNSTGNIFFGPTGVVSSLPTGATITPYFTTSGYPMTFNSAANPFFYSTSAGGTLTIPGSTATTGGVQVFQIIDNGETLTYFVTSDTTVSLTGTPTSLPELLSLVGTGYFTETGVVNYSTTAANFTISGSTVDGAVFSFGGTAATLPGTVTPEPSSLMLLGTGLLSAAGMATRKRRAIA